VRYRGLKKNREWLLAAFAAVNLYRHRKRLAPLGGSVPEGRKTAFRKQNQAVRRWFRAVSFSATPKSASHILPPRNLAPMQVSLGR
jgi:hypothetical protein